MRENIVRRKRTKKRVKMSDHQLVVAIQSVIEERTKVEREKEEMKRGLEVMRGKLEKIKNKVSALLQEIDELTNTNPWR